MARAVEEQVLYHRLQSGQIRILSVLKADRRDKIETTLRATDLKAIRGRYAALSYVWGKPVLTRTISCNGIDIKVTENCHSALLDLRSTLGAFTIWIDAICIDQSHTIEKNDQIKLMPQIYESASVVYAWLGPHSPGLGRAMRYFQSGSLAAYLPSKSCPGRITSAAIKLRGLTGASGPRGHDKAIINDVVLLLDCEYMRRMWTLQETLFATKLTIVCGEQHVDWNVFEDRLLRLTTIHEEPLRSHAISWLGLGKARERLRSDETQPKLSMKRDFMRDVLKRHALLSFALGSCLILPGLALIIFVLALGVNRHSIPGYVAAFPALATICGIYRALLAASEFREARHDTTDADNIVEQISHRKATFAEDIAFGVWNILGKLSASDVPDPSFTRERGGYDELYQVLARKLLETTDDLYILQLAATMPCSAADVPSWVPDWSLLGYRAEISNSARLIVDIEGALISSSERAMSIRAEEASRNEVEVGDQITVSARELGTLYDCMGFSKIHSPFSTAPEHITTYTRQLLLAMELAAYLGKLGASILDLLDDQGIAPADKPTPDEQEIWEQVIRFKPAHLAQEDFQKFADGAQLTGWTAAFPSIHIRIINMLADLDLQLCSVHIHSQIGTFTALCRGKVKDGDIVLRVQSLLQPIVVRATTPGSKVKIMSTLEMNTSSLWKGTSDRSMLRPLQRYQIC